MIIFGNYLRAGCFNFLSKRLLSISQLKERSLVCVHGTSADEFLQGLITTDIKSISRPNSFMYSLFLNSKGRVLTDAFIYHTNRLSANRSDYLVEVDVNYVPDLVKHLTQYNLRGKVCLLVLLVCYVLFITLVWHKNAFARIFRSHYFMDVFVFYSYYTS
ncbi:unnamed protein product [Schistosoma turkestanicum]|nr:unnamed protein product [Schistosoma turkestanicum]